MCSGKPTGAYTGQISAEMLTDLGVDYVILGHSETRGRFGVPEPGVTDEILRYYGETDATVNLKTQRRPRRRPVAHHLRRRDRSTSARQARPTPSSTARHAGPASKSPPNRSAPRSSSPTNLSGPSAPAHVCAADEADRVCGLVRAAVRDSCGQAAADAVRIQYGGSMKPDNAGELLSQPNIDGGLIGGASLKAEDFAAIIAAV